ncbi:citrulline utilization hydrolase CtlX [Pedobacter sp. PWIIR3]
MQATNILLMIRPVNFKFNEQTAENNKFQKPSNRIDTQQEALKEFDNFVAVLRKNDIEVMVIEDTNTPETPDSIFPNNWISFHESGKVILYPMFSENRRQERKPAILKTVKEKFEVKQLIDLSHYEQQDEFLEGTGSMVLDRVHKIAYACISSRTHETVMNDYSNQTGYKIVSFYAVDNSGYPIYHTNVMMCVAKDYAVVCLNAIPDEMERTFLEKTLQDTGKEIIDISIDQMNHFAGNMLQVKNKAGDSLLILSEQAYLSLSKEQIDKLEGYNPLVYAPLYTIEENGGGSARCMLAEIHLPKR